MIEDYKIVIHPLPESLEMEIKKYLASGYQPYGSIVVAKTGAFSQPMVKHKQESPEANDNPTTNKPILSFPPWGID